MEQRRTWKHFYANRDIPSCWPLMNFNIEHEPRMLTSAQVASKHSFFLAENRKCFTRLAPNGAPLLWGRANARNVSQHTLYGVQHIHINLDILYVLPPRRRRPKLVLTGTSIPLFLAPNGSPTSVGRELVFCSEKYKVFSSIVKDVRFHEHAL